jgi:hypothetical protein
MLSSEPDAKRGAVGLNVTDRTKSLCPARVATQVAESQFEAGFNHRIFFIVVYFRERSSQLQLVSSTGQYLRHAGT